ncbi:hypothetical protein D3C78_1907140 [compost metagenome]
MSLVLWTFVTRLGTAITVLATNGAEGCPSRPLASANRYHSVASPHNDLAIPSSVSLTRTV